MMKKFIISLGLLTAPLLLFAADSSAVATQKVDETPERDIGKISKAFGHMIGQNLASLGLDFDMKLVIQGIQDCVNGLESPMSEADCIKAISMIQENAFQKQCADNLKTADEFLEKNKTQAGVVEIEPGKLQYICLQAGEGAVVEGHFSPVIRYVGKFLDGKVFGESKQDEVIALDETIPGFKKAIVGMKMGEKRRVFIHPDLAYGTAGFLPPNSLLTFEIELVQVNSQKAEESAVSSTFDVDTLPGAEIALEGKKEVVH